MPNAFDIDAKHIRQTDFTKDLNDSLHMQKTYLHNTFGEVKAQKVDVRMGDF
jgi:hypothetical protein